MIPKMQVDANVSESNIGGIREGQEALFTVDAYPRVVISRCRETSPECSDYCAECGDLRRGGGGG